MRKYRRDGFIQPASRVGLFRENYTVETWTKRYKERGRFFVKFYRPV